MIVNIISMSWTIERDSNNSCGIDKLKKALKNSSDKGVLLFCPAPDKGQDRHPFSCPI
ncbi:hypothetical protein BDV41DRAFT_556574 [Aspergillus transmontanensis]|uniref:Uncharacterized protein n=1 Tax=Aspergillus transmontanensis TaxID=1034304 RepID=A0A5N6VF47_9EURO|nr:hypothetical protein BDV41DRAFT_556574 [Aspergillus transmontanensis]